MSKTYLGRESLGPEHVSPPVPADSPRYRNHLTDEERRSDRMRERLGRRLVRDARNGQTYPVVGWRALKSHEVAIGDVPERTTHSLWRIPERCDRKTGMLTPEKITRVANSVPRKQLELKGWQFVAPCPPTVRDVEAGLDEPVTLDDGSVTTLRAARIRELEHLARDINRRPQRTGRKRWLDGELIYEHDGDDSPIATRHGSRLADLEPSLGKKP